MSTGKPTGCAGTGNTGPDAGADAVADGVADPVADAGSWNASLDAVGAVWATGVVERSARGDAGLGATVDAVVDAAGGDGTRASA